jgi:ureidoacrylate peracid hydrolase
MESHVMSQTITLDAKPEPIAIEPSRAAVIVVDMQNDFGSRGGMFDRMGIPLEGFQKAADTTARVLDAARESGFKILYLKMGFRPDLSDLGAEGSPNRARHLAFGVGQTITTPEGRESRILIRDTWGTEIIDALQPRAEDVVIYKHRYSGFYDTELDAMLKQAGIDQLIFTGCTTSVCVESTLRDACFRDYQSVLLSDCIDEPIGKSLPRSNHDASLMLVEALFGWVTTSDQFLKACGWNRIEATRVATTTPLL